MPSSIYCMFWFHDRSEAGTTGMIAAKAGKSFLMANKKTMRLLHPRHVTWIPKTDGLEKATRLKCYCWILLVSLNVSMSNFSCLRKPSEQSKKAVTSCCYILSASIFINEGGPSFSSHLLRISIASNPTQSRTGHRRSKIL